MLNFNTIKFQLVALGVVLLAGGILVRQYIALPLLQEHVRALAATQQMSIASYVARDVDHSVTSRLALLERLAADLPPQLARQPEKLQAWIQDRQHINPMFNSGLMAVRPDGQGLLAEYPVISKRSQLDYAASDWFIAASRGAKPVIGKPWRGRANGDPIVIFAVPVRDAAGSLVTVLAGVAQLNVPGFLDRLQYTRLGATGGFLLVSPADRLFVASSDPALPLQATPPTGVNLLHDRAMSGFRGSGVTINAQGVEELSAMVTVPSTGWFVVARMPTEEAFRPVQVLRDFTVMVSTGLPIAVLTLLLFGLSRILRPLTSAAKAMRDMADGKSRLAPLPMGRNDEVGHLTSGFNFLVERLRKEEAAREDTEKRLKFMAHHDALTGLCNRTLLEDRLEQAQARAERNGKQIALLFCDLDGFKQINDEYGHDVGDIVLRQVADRLVKGRRRVDTVARLGGDEFIILLCGLDDARAGASIVARQCLASIEEAFEIGGKPLKLGMSIGIAVHAGAKVSSSHLISQADTAMYQAKRKGKGNFIFIDVLGDIGSRQPAG